jgi:hypothetical protein
MVTLGGDCHKRTHTLVAVDDNGQQVGAKTVSAVPAGHLEALDWALVGALNGRSAAFLVSSPVRPDSRP